MVWIDIKKTVYLEGPLYTGWANFRGILRHESRVESEEKAIKFLRIAE